MKRLEPAETPREFVEDRLRRAVRAELLLLFAGRRMVGVREAMHRDPHQPVWPASAAASEAPVAAGMTASVNGTAWAVQRASSRSSAAEGATASSSRSQSSTSWPRSCARSRAAPRSFQVALIAAPLRR